MGANASRVARMLAGAARYRKYLDEIHRELVDLLGDPDPEFGHTFDAVYVGNWSATKLIERVEAVKADTAATGRGRGT